MADLPMSVQSGNHSRLDRAQERGRRAAREPGLPYNPYRHGSVLWVAFNAAYEAEKGGR